MIGKSVSLVRQIIPATHVGLLQGGAVRDNEPYTVLKAAVIELRE